jgi:hypothetical protein
MGQFAVGFFENVNTWVGTNIFVDLSEFTSRRVLVFCENDVPGHFGHVFYYS